MYWYGSGEDDEMLWQVAEALPYFGWECQDTLLKLSRGIDTIRVRRS